MMSVYGSREEAEANMDGRDYVVVEHVYTPQNRGGAYLCLSLYDPVDIIHKITWEPAHMQCDLGFNCYSYSNITGNFPQGLALTVMNAYTTYLEFLDGYPTKVTVRGIVASKEFLKKIEASHPPLEEKKFMRTSIECTQPLPIHPRCALYPPVFYSLFPTREFQVFDPPEWYPTPSQVPSTIL
jgi:hypothetical protein